MADWQFKIDGVVKDTPRNWKDSEITIKRDPIFKTLLINHTSQLEFYGTAYTALRTLYDADLCDSATCTIEYKCEDTAASFTEMFAGTIYVADIEWDHWRCIARVQVEDESYSSMIANNRKVKAYLGVGRSKNDTSYTGATQQVIDFFLPSSGSYTVNLADVEAYTVADAFEDLVFFMSDDTMTFTNNITALDSLVICTGEAINNAGSTGYAPYISFEDLYEEIDKRYNIGAYIDTSGAKPDLVIDELANLYDSTNAVTVTNVRELKEFIDSSLLYGRVDIGSNTTEDAGSVPYSWPDVRFFNHKAEEYHTAGTCNTDNVLDLVGDWVVDSNVIEKICIAVDAAGTEDEYDDDIFLIETDLPGTAQADRFDIFTLGAAPYSYNKNLTNSEVSQRFDGVIYADLLHYLGDGNDGFEADLTSTTNYGAAGANFEPVTYDTEISDPNANYDNVTNYDYSCPQDGFYRFQCSVEISNYVSTGPAASGDLEVILRLRHYDGGGYGGGNLVAQYSSSTIVVTADTEVVFTDVGFFAASGEDVRVRVEANWQAPGPIGAANFDIDGGTYETLEVTTGGGIYRTYEADDTRVLFYEWEAPLSITDLDSLLANPTHAITFNIPRTATTKKAWIEEINYPVSKQKPRIKVVTTRNT